jgi:hypothetical protein
VITEVVSGSSFNLNVEGLNPGVYFIRVTDDGKEMGAAKVSVVR